MNSIEGVGQMINAENDEITATEQAKVDQKFDEIWSKETSELDPLIKEINVQTARILKDLENKILGEYHTIFKMESNKHDIQIRLNDIDSFKKMTKDDFQGEEVKAKYFKQVFEQIFSSKSF